MQIKKLDHVNIRTQNLSVMVDWYTQVLGLTAGKRPDFSFGGAWMYAGDDALVHLIEVGDAPGAGSESALKLEHFALSGTGFKAFMERLDTMGIRYRQSGIESFKLIQVNVWDPDGNHIHVDFSSDEDA